MRITRLSGDLSQKALATDLVLQASSDQSSVDNTYQVTKSVNAPVCAPIDPSTCPCQFSGGSDQNNSAGNRPSSSGCAMGRSNATGSILEIALAGLLGLAPVRTLKKRR